MANYYEATSIREYTDKNGEVKKQYTRLGVAFPFKDKDGFSVKLDAIPAPQEGVYTIMLFPPKPKETTRQGITEKLEKNGLEVDDEIQF